MEITPKEQLILTEWKTRERQYEEAKKALKLELSRYGMASREFNAAKVEFEMLKEEFDNFEKENHKILAKHNVI